MSNQVHVVTYRIRRVRSREDLQLCFAVIGAVFEPPIAADDWRLDRLLAAFESSRTLMVVAERGDEVVGGVLGVLRDDVVGIDVVGFDESVRGIGLARRVMQTVEVEAMALGARTLSLGALPEAHGFYARLGYHGKRVGMGKGLPLPGSVRDLRVRKLLAVMGDLDRGAMVGIDPSTGRIPPLL